MQNTVHPPLRSSGVFGGNLCDRVTSLIGSELQKANWDSYNAAAVETRTLIVAAKVAERLEGLMFDGKPMNFVAATRDGGIEFSDGDDTVWIRVHTCASICDGTAQRRGNPMSRSVVTITSDAEFAAFCKSPQNSARVEFRVNRVTLPPTGLTLRHASDIEIVGETAPAGRVQFTGGRLTLLGCESVTISRVGFRLQRLANPVKAGLFETYERSWKPLAIHAEHPDRPCRKITLRQCSFAGMTDELEAGPSNHEAWFAKWVDRPAVIELTFDRCMFGPSFVNTGATITDASTRATFLNNREFHNMSISVAYGEGVAFVGCVFCGANRRSPQVAAKRVGMAHCVVDDWGSMAVGLHAGADVEINACHFMRGPHTRGNKRAAGLVEGTEQTAFAKLGPATLAVSDNTVEYNSVGGAVRKGWNISHTAAGKWLKRGKVVAPLPLRTIADIVNKAGCGDSLDVAIRWKLARMQHVPWMRDYSPEFLFPKG